MEKGLTLAVIKYFITNINQPIYTQTAKSDIIKIYISISM